jgi:phospholipase/lecithinase/hemolysin
VAVPGARVIDPTSNLDPSSTSNALTTFLLGGLTQVDMVRRARPTFVSVWIGNNDVLGAATSLTNGGDTTLITAAATFQARYQTLLDQLADAGVGAGVLVGVANVTSIPYFSRGSTYWAIKNGQVPGQAFPPTFSVDNNCAPLATMIPGARGDSTLVPFPYGGTLLTLALGGTPTTLSCADGVPQTVVPAELRALVAAVTAYNTFIQGRATALGWAYVDPNQALDSLRTIPTQIAPFPAFVNATGQPNPCTANPFGLAFSCDAVHPSSATHRLIANKLRQAINASYGTSIPVIP